MAMRLPGRGKGWSYAASATAVAVTLPSPRRGWHAVAGAVLAFLAAACSPGDAPVSPGPPPASGLVAETPAAMASEARTIYDERNERLKGVRFFEDGWRTDFSRHSVPLTEIRMAAGPRDSTIPAIDSPVFIPVKEAVDWPMGFDLVVALEMEATARAYPVPILRWHEIVNDVVAGVPVAVTFCPLCNSAVVFDRRVGGVEYDFGVSGNLRNGDLVMYDRQTHSWWQQLTGEGIVGEHSGKRLSILPAAMLSWADFEASFPDGLVLSRNTGFQRDYGRDPYVTDDGDDLTPILVDEVDGRLPVKEKVVGVTVGGIAAAFPFSVLRGQRVVNFAAGEERLVVFLENSGLAAAFSTGAFDPRVDGEVLTFSVDGDRFVDDQTGSEWSVLGRAAAGPLAGKRMDRVAHGDYFWFAWAAFNPDTVIYRGP